MNTVNISISSIEHITPDVLRVVTQKPPGYRFTPGQAAEISINRAGWLHEKRPFSFTSLPENHYLEFIIKTYPARKQFTNQLLQLKAGNRLLLHPPFGAIAYKSEGVFIAGGAGITPFISIIRQLWHQKMLNNNRLIFANNTKADIILADELKRMLGDRFISILSAENAPGHAYGQVNAAFIQAHSGGLNKYFYLCGPPPMTAAITAQLKGLGVHGNAIVQEAMQYSQAPGM